MLFILLSYGISVKFELKKIKYQFTFEPDVFLCLLKNLLKSQWNLYKSNFEFILREKVLVIQKTTIKKRVLKLHLK